MSFLTRVIKKVIEKKKVVFNRDPVSVKGSGISLKDFGLMFNWDYIYQNGDFGLSEYFRNKQYGWPNIHNGTDFTSRRSKIGLEVYAPFDFEFARVIIGEEKKGHGSQVHLYHKENFRLSISHMEVGNIFITHGQTGIKQGDLIGLMGNRGNSTGKHFHVELVAVKCNRNDRPYLDGCPVLDNYLEECCGTGAMTSIDMRMLYSSCKKTKDWALDLVSKDYEGNIRIPHGINFLGKNKIIKRIGKGHDLITKTYYNVYYFMSLT